MLPISVLTVLVATLLGYSETTESTVVIPKPIGTVLTPNSKQLPTPAYNVELISKDGKKITATVLGFRGGVNIQTTDGKTYVIPWAKLSWETSAKLSGQEISYTKAGMDPQWYEVGRTCSRERYLK